MDIFGSIDPFFVLKVGDESQKTTKKVNQKNPVYNESFSFCYDPSFRNRDAFIECYDWDKFSKNRFVGKCEIPYLEFHDQTAQRLFELKDAGGKGRGFVQLEITFKTIDGVIKSQRTYIPASHPLVIYAAYDYTPPTDKSSGSEPHPVSSEPDLNFSESAPDAAGSQVEPDSDFHDLPLKENHGYLLQRSEYPWPEWCTVLPLQYASEEEVNKYYAGKEGPHEHLLYLENPKFTKGGFAPASYFNPEYLTPAVAHLLSNPDSLTETMAILVNQGTKSKPLPGYIPISHPLIIYAQYDYEPKPPENPNEPVLDNDHNPLESGFCDMPLKENNAYLLRRDDYPWPEWCSVVPLQYASGEDMDAYFTKMGGARETLVFLDDSQKNTRGGFAPTSYFFPEYVTSAKGHLLSNPGDFEAAFAILTH